MASVTGYTAARMQEIEDSAIIDGAVVGDDLILTRYDTTTINAGNVRGPVGTMPSVARVRVRCLSTGIALPNNTVTAVDWNDTTEDWDTNGFHSTVTNISRLTIPTSFDGVYLASFVLFFPATVSTPTTSIVSAWMQKNGAATRYGFAQNSNNVGNGISLAASEPLPMSVGDYLQVFAYQNSGIAMTYGTALSGFSLARIGPL
jgi:hypothetical protein